MEVQLVLPEAQNHVIVKSYTVVRSGHSGNIHTNFAAASLADCLPENELLLIPHLSSHSPSSESRWRWQSSRSKIELPSILSS